MTNTIPVYFKVSVIILGLLGFFFILWLGQSIIVPLTFAGIISILLNPLVNFFMGKGINRIIAITIAITLLIIVVTGIMLFIGSQVSMFSDSWPTIKLKFNALFKETLKWVSETFNVGKSKVNAWINERKAESLNDAGGMIGDTVSTITSMMINLLLIPVYIFLFLFYKPLLLNFTSQIFADDKHKTVAEVLFNTKSLIQNYLVGLLIEMAIVATMNSVALLIIGIDYAIMLGVIGALLNLIPYIGGVVAISLPMLMALITDTPFDAVLVLIAYLIIQIIDNNFLVPKIVASKVKVNALISIIVVLIGGALWGVAGMFLSIPVTAILKVIFDKIPHLKPLGFLIGDTMPPIGKAIFDFREIQARLSPKKKIKVVKTETTEVKVEIKDSEA
ncbi:MAG: AI-2E family transporter [Bacteroidetes bacterium]|nr:AI-2E family transporter [Bacteroidota bacterium]